MTVNPITPQNQNLQQVQSTQGKSGEEAFHDMTKSKGYDKDELEGAVSQKTQLTRTKKSDRSHKKHLSLLALSDENDLEEEAVYRTVMVDGVLFTLRLLAVA